MNKMNSFWVLVLLFTLWSCGGATEDETKEETEKAEKTEGTGETSESGAVNIVEWMKQLDDQMAICRIAIPGTHDSGAKGEGGMVATQDLSIEKQLEEGIRCFDIRLRASGEQLKIYHGFFYQGITFEKDVVPVFVKFLKEHPSEMLIVSLKDEGGDAGEYRRLVWEEVSDVALQPYVVKHFREDLTLGECRGKILFLHRHNLKYAQMFGGEFTPGGWKDNSSFSCPILGNNNHEAACRVEDEYNFSSLSGVPEKVAAAMKNMEAAREENADGWFITFASATTSNLSATPLAFAEQVNVALAEKVEAWEKGGCGVLLLDFAGKDHGVRLVRAVIKSNGISLSE